MGTVTTAFEEKKSRIGGWRMTWEKEDFPGGQGRFLWGSDIWTQNHADKGWWRASWRRPGRGGVGGIPGEEEMHKTWERRGFDIKGIVEMLMKLKMEWVSQEEVREPDQSQIMGGIPDYGKDLNSHLRIMGNHWKVDSIATT